MKLLPILFSLLFLLPALPGQTKPFPFSLKELQSPPARIIRTCCSFGSDLRVKAVPTMKVTHISSLEKIGPHRYMGNHQEGNGIIYTRRGGFIDLAHLRDQADWTAYLYAVILESRQKGGILQRLGHEGGTKTLDLRLLDQLDSTDAAQLAGRIAYDLSVWHEIATWFGASYIPLISERYSSFSVEDAYSNLLGVRLGIAAIQSELPFEKAMTLLISQALEDLEAVTTEADTYTAMENVREIWWTREKKIPSGQVLLARQIKVYPLIQPLLVPGLAPENPVGMELTVPDKTRNGQPLTNLYELIFRPNYKFPFRDLFPEENRRFLTQRDFDLLLLHVAKEWHQADSRPRPRGLEGGHH